MGKEPSIDEASETLRLRGLEMVARERFNRVIYIIVKLDFEETSSFERAQIIAAVI
jgi:hypothetical protein